VSPVFPEVDVPGIVHLLQDELDDFLVASSAGPDEPVIGDVQLGPESPEEAADAVAVCLGGLALGPGAWATVVAVLVGPGQEKVSYPASL